MRKEIIVNFKKIHKISLKLRYTEEQFKIASCIDLHNYVIKLFLYYLH